MRSFTISTVKIDAVAVAMVVKRGYTAVYRLMLRFNVTFHEDMATLAL